MTNRLIHPIEEPFGPVYNVDSPALQKHRRQARHVGSVMEMTPVARRAYADAVEAAIRSKNKTKASTRMPGPNCASGTWYSDGRDISRAVREQNNRRLAAVAARDRKRTPEQWQALYAETMAEKLSLAA